MTDAIITFLTGEKLPPGGESRIGFDGLSPGWAVLAFIVLTLLSAFAYFRYAKEIPKVSRLTLIILRAVGLAVILLLLTKPIVHLTINEPVRQSLLVLVDSSASMLLNDRRTQPEDLKRAAIAAGLMSPNHGLNGDVPSGADALANLNRWELFQKLAANDKMNLWARLQEKSTLSVYRFGRDAVQVGTMEPAEGQKNLRPEDAVNFFKQIQPTEPATGIGESLRQVLESNRGQAIAGILLVTDGANNSGLPPAEASRVAMDQNVPLFIYGLGVTTPADLIMQDISPPKLAFMKERLEVKGVVRSQGIRNKEIEVTLKANGKIVDTEKLKLDSDGEHELLFHYIPEETGEVTLEANIPVLPEEVAKDNNLATAKLRVVDNKIHVLFIDQEPRWDFRYLLAYLQRDRRLETKAVLIDGEPDLDKLKDSPFLPKLPDDREGLFKYEIIIIGDVDPKSLGETRMKILSEWVEQTSGGIIFLAGTKYNPIAYAGTPLEALLPIVPDTTIAPEKYKERSQEGVKLKLTSIGESSPYLLLSENPTENQKIWSNFPSVRWTALVARAKPAAQVLLVDPRPERASRDGPLPVMVTQSYGSGETVFLGTDETYRWRSHIGEKYYSQVWGLVMQSLSLARLQGASSKTQLKIDRLRYFVGDKIIISGKVYDQSYTPLTANTLQGAFKVKTVDADGKPGPEQTLPFDVTAVHDQPGEYHGEYTVKIPGEYSYSTLQDPSAALRFEVVEPKLEQMETAMDTRVLEGMATAAHGRFFREETLNELPDLVSKQSATVALFKKVDLFYSYWWLVIFIFIAACEWLLRRLNSLK